MKGGIFMDNKECMHNKKCECDRYSVENMCDMNNDKLCGCVGYGYVPWQGINEVYCADKGLCRGTIFPELDLTIDEYGSVCKRKGIA